MISVLNSTFSFVKRVYNRVELGLRKPSYTGKVFCIGYNKTGTTSLGRALAMLGYRHSSFNQKVWREYYKKGKIIKVLEYTAKFDSFDDLPWLKEDMIPVLYNVFPNSKFIYLTRDEESWKQSIYNWTLKMTGEYPDIDDRLARFRMHREFVLNYFKDKPTDIFLELDIQDAEGFRKLAVFLGKQPVQNQFPHYNKTLTL